MPMLYTVPMHRGNRVNPKDEQLFMRLPRSDKRRLETQAERTLRSVSDLAWVLIRKGLEQMEADQQRHTDPR
jgi:predicted DNA-binding protein